MLLTTTEIMECLSGGPTSAARAVERAVIEKLCAGVEMPDVSAGTLLAPGKGQVKVYTDDQLRAYGAAQRLKALEDCLNEIEGWANDQSELKAAIRALKGEA